MGAMEQRRIGILTDEVFPEFDRALDWCKAQALGHVEVRVVDGRNTVELDDATIDGVRRRVEGRGLVISAIASPLFKCALDPGRPVASGDRFGQEEEGVEAHFRKLDRVMEIARRLGTTRVRVFSFWREVEPTRHREEIVRHLRRAAGVAERAGVQLLLENEPSCNGGFAEEVGEIVRAVNHPSMRALWDPGNEAYGGKEAFPAGYRRMREVVAHVHLKDAYIDKGGASKCVPLGSGDVPWVEQFRALAEDGYQGLFTIETHYAPAGSTKAVGSKMTLDALRTLVEAAGV